MAGNLISQEDHSFTKGQTLKVTIRTFILYQKQCKILDVLNNGGNEELYILTRLIRLWIGNAMLSELEPMMVSPIKDYCMLRLKGNWTLNSESAMFKHMDSGIQTAQVCT